ncbi:MAG TPA: HAMP domain-containing sensor histidine kinase [Sphingomonas sp.]|nr:HAMP domain-containing sensor histidine kinase [Sphingomonas sp.]
MLRSAAYRIAIVSSAAFALATMVLGLIVYLSAHAAFTRQLDDRIREDSATLVSEFRAEGRAGLIAAIERRQREDATNDLGYGLFEAGRGRVAGALVTAMPPPGLSDIVFHDPDEGPDPARAITTVLPDGSRLVVAADRAPLERIDRTIVTLFGAAFLAVLAIGAAGAVLLGAYLRRRLSAMSGTAEAIMHGDLGQRVVVGPHSDEFDRLAALLNTMLDRITALLDNLRQVSSDVAHDLRTPLARLRNGLDGGLRHGHVPDERDAAIEQAIARSDDVLTLFSALLRISEVEAGGVKRAFAPLDITLLARELAESYAPAIEDGGRQLACAIDADAMIVGDRELVSQALINLLDNAQIHTPAGTMITLMLRQENTRVLLTVADDGPGVPGGEHARLIQRFVRRDASRSRPGHGLGLSLVSAIASAHDANLVIADHAPGLSVTLDFPRVDR